MRSYTFRAVQRGPDGVIGPTLYERIIVAANDDMAVEQARALDPDLAEVGANAMYLATLDGRAVWSLHIPETPIEADAFPRRAMVSPVSIRGDTRWGLDVRPAVLRGSLPDGPGQPLIQ